MNGEEIFQVTAMDATEPYALSSKLKRENSVLRGMNARLKVYRPQGGSTRENAADKVAMKIQIHDSIGQNLMMTGYYLAAGSTGSIQEGFCSDPAKVAAHDRFASP